MPILLVEDDDDLAVGLKTALQNEGFAVNRVALGRDALAAVVAAVPDIVILDIGLPDIDGLTVLQRIRKTLPDLPVIILTARATLDDKVAGLDCGADDYLAKPFETEELLARLRVMQRRQSAVKSNEIEIGPVTLDTATQNVRIGADRVELARREYMVLKALMENAGRVQTRESLEDRLYSWGEEIASNAVEVHIHHLRKKLAPDFIKTIRGVGYVIDKA